jgi:hypothetical protein
MVFSFTNWLSGERDQEICSTSEPLSLSAKQRVNQSACMANDMGIVKKRDSD